MGKIVIEINNNKCKLHGKDKKLKAIHNAFKIRHPGAFHIRRSGNAQPNWDGKINYVTEAYYFKIGMLPQICKWIEDNTKDDVYFEDYRKEFEVKPKVPKKVGNLEPFAYQARAIKVILNNDVMGLPFPLGVINAATNAGKTIIMAGVWLAYKKKVRAVVILNDGDLFDQFKTEIPELVGHENFGYVRGKEAKWNNFTICMAQTLSRNIHPHKNELHKAGIVLVDECDLADNKTYKTILNNCINARVRLGLSGSVFLSKLAKDKPRNQNIHSYFGDEIFKITNKELVEKGQSTNMIIKFFTGSIKPGIKGDWKGEYDRGIMYNEDRAMLCVERLKVQAKLGRLPAMVVCQFHKHIELMDMIFQKELGKKYNVVAVHGDTKDRAQIMIDFREGKIDILIASFIIKRGKNFPLLRYVLNAAGSDSHATILQIMGRLFRKHESKKRVIMEDLFDEGVYLKRHSKHRLIYYKKEGFKVIDKR